jgi:hypothetical protein
MLDASALLILQPVTTVSIPAKLYEYMATGRPVLALAEPGGETAELVTRSGAGVAVRADDRNGIALALRALFSGDPASASIDPSVYDGTLRARDITRVLDSVLSENAGLTASGAGGDVAVGQPTETGR